LSISRDRSAPRAGGIVHAGASITGHQPLPGGSWHIRPVSRHTTGAGTNL